MTDPSRPWDGCFTTLFAVALIGAGVGAVAYLLAHALGAGFTL